MALASAFGYLGTAGLLAGMLCFMLIPRCVDPDKLRKEGDRDLVGMLSNPWLPKRVLTPFGVKLWLARNWLFGIGLISVALSFAFR